MWWESKYELSTSRKSSRMFRECVENGAWRSTKTFNFANFLKGECYPFAWWKFRFEFDTCAIVSGVYRSRKPRANKKKCSIINKNLTCFENYVGKTRTKNQSHRQIVFRVVCEKDRIKLHFFLQRWKSPFLWKMYALSCTLIVRKNRYGQGQRCREGTLWESCRYINVTVLSHLLPTRHKRIIVL